jgi:hypothetical protein
MKEIKPMAPPPTGPRAFQPPKGPAADRRDSRDHRRKSSNASVPTTPTTPTAPKVQDHYAAEREKNARERDRLDRDKVISSVHHRATSRSGSISTSTPTAPAALSTSHSKPPSAKRPRDNDEPAATEVKGIPTGPRSKRRKSDINSENVAQLFAAGLRKHASGRERRRGGVKMEGEVERELERGEREREGGRR